MTENETETAAPAAQKCVVHRPDYSTLERLEVADNHALYQVGCRECSSTAAIVISDEDCHQWT